MCAARPATGHTSTCPTPVTVIAWCLAAATDKIANLLSFQEDLGWKRALICHSHVPPPVSAVIGNGHAVSHLFGSAVLPAA